MEELFFAGSREFNLIVLPLLIFLARVVDVSLDTLRIIFISKGMILLAPFLAFFEVLIWLIAISQIFQNIDNPVYYLAFSGGFAIGNFVGIYLEEKLSIGTQVIRVITQKEGTGRLQETLKSYGFGGTCLEGEGTHSRVKVIYLILNRKDVTKAIGIIKSFHPKAFYTIEDVKRVSEKIPPLQKPWYRREWLSGQLFRPRMR